MALSLSSFENRRFSNLFRDSIAKLVVLDLYLTKRLSRLRRAGGYRPKVGIWLILMGRWTRPKINRVKCEQNG